MRDNFTKETKETLAKRVAWKCSFPGCGRITVGPGHETNVSTLNLGEAAHIHAASPNGPRPNTEMSSAERRSINNGIWMCRTHARLIDADHTNYSASTIKQWKVLAEKNTYKQLMKLEKDPTNTPLTLISIGSRIIFEGLWKSVRNSNWTFEVRDFIVGNIENLKEFSATQKANFLDSYIVVETQGDGRVLNKDFSWSYDDTKLQIEVSVKEKAKREDPNNIGGDIVLDENGDLLIENGDLKAVIGVEHAKQLISNVLSMGFGELRYAPTLGSYFSGYYWKFKDKPELLNRLLKLEITRLVSIPTFEPRNPTSQPPLNFINRILNVEMLSSEIHNNRIPVKMRLEWGNGEIWEDTVKIYVHEKPT